MSPFLGRAKDRPRRMQWKRLSRMLSREQAAGFTLVELLVSLFLTGIVLVLMSGVFSGSSHARRQMNLRTEVQQGLRSLAEMVTGELRQAGACLPPVGQFIS